MMTEAEHPWKEGRDAIAAAAAMGWTASRSKTKFKMTCACGKHITWMHLTPSNPNYFKERLRYFQRTCYMPPDETK